MKKYAVCAAAILTSSCVVTLARVAHAEIYESKTLSNIGVNSDGSVFIKWEGSPTPSPSCGGSNFGWVKIPSTANEAIKSLALSIYFSGKIARIDTSGCDGPYEVVVTLYSPTG
jgi:hypothetical protein